MSLKDIYKEKYLEIEIIGKGNFGILKHIIVTFYKDKQ